VAACTARKSSGYSSQLLGAQSYRIRSSAIHCVKHSLAFLMLKNGARLNEVQKYRGWRSPAIAQHYLGVTDETAGQAAREAFVNV